MMALARGEMPYGRFVQEDTLIGVRTAAAIRPFTQEAGVIDQVAMAAPAADQSADCRRVLLCKWASPLPLNHGYQIASVRFRRVSGRDHPVSGADDRGRVRGRQRRVKGRITYRQLTRPSDVYCRRVPANLTGTPVAQNATIIESPSSRFTSLPNFSIVRSPRPYLPHHVGGEDRGETAGLAHPASPAARRRPDKYSSRCSGFLQFMALGTTTFVRLRSRSMASRASSRRPMCA